MLDNTNKLLQIILIITAILGLMLIYKEPNVDVKEATVGHAIEEPIIPESIREVTVGTNNDVIKSKLDKVPPVFYNFTAEVRVTTSTPVNKEYVLKQMQTLMYLIHSIPTTEKAVVLGLVCEDSKGNEFTIQGGDNGDSSSKE